MLLPLEYQNSPGGDQNETLGSLVNTEIPPKVTIGILSLRKIN